MLIKVCGLTEPSQVQRISRKVDYVGFIFHPDSKRFTSSSYPSYGAKKTGVFVNLPLEEALRLTRLQKLDSVQLHGEEQPEYCAAIADQVQVIKAFGIHDDFDFDQLKKYEGSIHYFLFDTKCSTHGGSGQQFNWSLIENYTLSTPFFLSGGIGPDSVEQLKTFQHPAFAGIDVNSRFEIEPGIKDEELLNNFLDDYRNN